jgi:hypothetical protein
MFQINVVEKVKTHILCSVNFFFLEVLPLRGNVEKCGRAREATDDNNIWCMCLACWMSKATSMHTYTSPGQMHWHMHA